MLNKYNYLRTTTAIAAMAALGLPAHAQVDDATGGETEARVFDTIVVEGRLRNETLQDVPASVSVVTEESIERLGIREVDDFIELVPNVTFFESQNQGNTALSIRGVGQIRNVDPPAAIVIDGVQTIDPFQFNQSFYDVEQIEVFRGPQGAYWGRNAIQGAINITTKRPGDELETDLVARYQSGNDIFTSGVVSGPLVEDQVYFKVSGFYQTRDGQIDTTNFEDADFLDQYGLKGNLLFTPNENLSIDVRAGYQNFEGGALYWSTVPVTLQPDDAVGTQSTVDLPGVSERELTDASVKIDYDFGSATLTSISAFTDLTDDLFGDADFGDAPDGAPDVFQHLTRDVESFSQEVRLTSPDSGPFRWQIGGFYLSTDRTETIDVGGDFDRDGTFEVPFVAGADNFEQDSWALFGNVQYDFTDRLELNVALRYDEDTFTAVPVAGGAQRELNADEFQPRVDLKYDVTDETNVYASYAVGFRSGRLNASTVPGGLEVADPEKATTYEVGFKSRVNDLALTLNGAAFYTEYENQLAFFGSPAFGQLAINLDETTLWGLEFDARMSPTDNLDLFASVGYVDAEIDEFGLVPPAGVLLIDPTTIPGNTVPRVHDVTLNVGGQLTLPVSNEFDVVIYADHEYLGERADSISNNFVSDGFSRTDLRVSLENDKWTFTAFGKNIFDTEYTDEFVAFTEEAGPPFNFFFPDEGAVWGGEIRVSF